MALKKDKVSKFIEKGNFQGLQSYLNEKYYDIDSLIPSKEFINAFNKFISSDSKNITNSYKIIELLYHYFADANRKIKYDNSQEHEDIKGLFKIYEKISAGKDYSIEDVVAVTGIKDFKVDSYQKKFELYQEKQTLRNVYKKADDLIEKDLIYKIKYPENTGFIRKLLKILPKRKSEDILNDFTKTLPEFIDKLRTEIEKDPKFNDKKGNFLLTNPELNQIIYERLSLKATKQLGLDQNTIDKVLTELNTKKIQEAIDNIDKATMQECPEYAKQLQEIFNSQIPSHSIRIYSLKIGVKGINKNATEEEKKSYESYKEIMLSTFKEHLEVLKFQVTNYKGKPGQEYLLEQSIKGLIVLNEGLSEYDSYSSLKLHEKDVAEYVKILEETQVNINKKLIANNKKYELKVGLTEFEKRGIKLLSESSYLKEKEEGEFIGEIPDYWKDPYISNEDKKFLEEFMVYSQGNKEFNIRLGKVLSSNSNFKGQYKKEITQIYSFSYKTQNLESIAQSIFKIENILTKLAEDEKYKFSLEDKITFSEIGRIKKFLDIDTIIGLIEYNNDDKIYVSNISNLIQLHEKANILSTLEKVFQKDVSYEPGDLVMNVARRVREYNSNKGEIYDRVRDFMSPYLHAAVVDKKKGNQVILSHVNKVYAKDNGKMTEILAENFRIYPDKLVKDEVILDKLKGSFNLKSNEDLKQKLHGLYMEVSSKLHGSLGEKSEQMEFHYKKGIKAFAGDLIPLGLGHRGKENIRDWAQDILKEREHIGQKIKDQNGDYIICSEFAAKMTVLSLVELENQLVDKIKEKEPNFELPKGGLIKMPFQEYEDLGKVHPARLVKELSKSGAIEKVPEAEMIKNIIRTR